jgi:hypothetical protein
MQQIPRIQPSAGTSRPPWRLAKFIYWCALVPTLVHGYDCREGQPHPDFTLPRIDNEQPISLSDYLGRKVLIVHFASW